MCVCVCVCLGSLWGAEYLSSQPRAETKRRRLGLGQVIFQKEPLCSLNKRGTVPFCLGLLKGVSRTQSCPSGIQEEGAVGVGLAKCFSWNLSDSSPCAPQEGEGDLLTTLPGCSPRKASL